MPSDTPTAPWGELRHVTANGLRFACFEGGRGPLALLLHGFPDTPRGYDDLAPALVAAGYHVVAPFTRGYHPTEVPPDRAITHAQLAADALALIPALGHDAAAVLVGHDWGASTAYAAATAAPERVERLVAIGIPHPGAVKASLHLAWQARHFLTLRMPGAARRFARRDFAGVDALYRRWSPTWRYEPRETAPVKACFSHRDSLDSALAYYRGLSPRTVLEPLRGEIRVPTLVVAGTDDPAVSVATYEAAARKFSGGYRVVALPGGHFVHRESPDGFCAAVLSFLAEESRLAGC